MNLPERPQQWAEHLHIDFLVSNDKSNAMESASILARARAFTYYCQKVVDILPLLLDYKMCCFGLQIRHNGQRRFISTTNPTQRCILDHSLNILESNLNNWNN